MFKFKASILKELRLLVRDRMGLAIMFLMPIILVLVITSIQDNTFEMLNDNKVTLLLCNEDTGQTTDKLILSVQKMGMFKIIPVKHSGNENMLRDAMNKHDAMVALLIPADFSYRLNQKVEKTTRKALMEFGMIQDSIHQRRAVKDDSLIIIFNPVLEESYRQSISGALKSAILLTENKLMVKSLYFSINQKPMSENFENEIMQNSQGIKEKVSGYDGNDKLPNATQHNIPAWTVFAMFFMVISLGGNIVKEKLSGSFIRLKVLPTSYFLGLVSKQIIYLMVVLVLVLTIFSIGVWLFPLMGLPALNMPSDFAGLLIVSAICGLCAISYALCIGVFAKTQEQSSGFGSVSIVILAAIGGVFVPAFAMPHSFQTIMKFSPFYWSLQSYYGLFLENRKLTEIIINILPLLACTLFFQVAAFIGLKRKNLI